MMHRIAIIGFGPQALNSHLPIISRIHRDTDSDVCISVIADYEHALQLRRETISKLNPKPHIITIPNDIDWSYKVALNVITECVNHNISGIIISSEATSHAEYVKAALRRNISFLVDKPFVCLNLLSVDKNAVDQGKRILNEIEENINNTSKSYVNIARRLVPHFRTMRNEITRCYQITNQPVTSVIINYSDGEARSSIGILEQDNHPFKLGYGSINHSTYHAVDTGLWLVTSTLGSAIHRIQVTAVSRTSREYLSSRKTLKDDFQLVDNLNNSYRERKEGSIGENDYPYDTEFDVIISVKITCADGQSSIINVNSIHDSPTIRTWKTPASEYQRLRGARMSDECYLVNQGEMQSLFLRCRDFPSNSYPIGEKTPSINRQHHLEITRGALYSNFIQEKQHEVLSSSIKYDALKESGKFRAMQAFLKVGELSDISHRIDLEDKKDETHSWRAELHMSQHILTQRILLLAADSIIQGGAPAVWTSEK